MTTRTWRGGSGDFYDPSQWSNGVPIFGDSVVINAGTVIAVGTEGAASGVFDAQPVTLGSTISNAPAQITAINADLGLNFDITSTTGSPFAKLLSVGTSGFAGLLLAEAPGGTFTIQTQATAPRRAISSC